MHRMSKLNGAKWLLLSFFVLAVIIFASPSKYLTSFVEDDGYFYAVISNNFAHGLGSTFDRISMTNGYHPLWMLTLSGYIWFVDQFVDTLRLDPGLFLKILFLFQLALYLVNLYLCVDIIKKVFAGCPNLLIGIFTVGYAFTMSQNFLMETGISLLIMLTLVEILLKGDRWNHSTGATSVLFGFWVLARLDQAIAVGLIAAIIACSRAKRKPQELFSLFSRILIFPILLALAYLLSNMYFFGHYQPVSSYIKTATVSFTHFWNALVSVLDVWHPRFAVHSFVILIAILALVSVPIRYIHTYIHT